MCGCKVWMFFKENYPSMGKGFIEESRLEVPSDPITHTLRFFFPRPST